MNRFVIGIGSQRAGSTLLYRILDECSDIFMHPVKELHYYDTLYGQRAERSLKVFSRMQIDRELSRIIAAPDFEFIDNRYRCYLRTNHLLLTRDVADVDYLDLYHPCLSQHETIGEITPEYMLLPDKGVRQMHRELGEDTRIILLARHPVRRFVSAFKLLKHYRGEELDEERFARDLDEVIDTMPTWIEHQEALNNYKRALARYRKHFDHVLLLSYDQLVGEPERTRQALAGFLEMELDAARLTALLGDKVNALGETGEAHSATLKSLYKRFRPSIRFLDKTFGPDACVL